MISYFWNLKLIPSNGVFMNNAAYAEESETGSPPGLYYLVHWKGYPVSDNTWEPSSGVKHLRRLLVTYHKRNPKEPTASSVPIAPRPPSAKKELWSQQRPLVDSIFIGLRSTFFFGNRSLGIRYCSVRRRKKTTNKYQSRSRAYIFFDERVIFFDFRMVD